MSVKRKTRLKKPVSCGRNSNCCLLPDIVTIETVLVNKTRLKTQVSCHRKVVMRTVIMSTVTIATVSLNKTKQETVAIKMVTIETIPKL